MATIRRVPDQWLSRGVEKLFFPDAGPVRPIDVLIVGSGYGGSVAAARFAAMEDKASGRPLRVVLLERGDEYVPGAFPDRFEQVVKMARLESTLKADEPIDRRQSGLDQALFDVRMGKEVTAIVGNGLGGGSLINAGVVERPLPDVFSDSTWPKALCNPVKPGARTALDDFFARVETMLGAAAFSPMLPKTIALTDDVAILAAEAGARPTLRSVKVAVTQGPQQPAPVPLGVPNAVGVLQAPCNLCGNCVTGCNYGAKNILPMNYLALAASRGAEIFTGATVLGVRPDGVGQGWIVSLRRTHDRGERDAPGAVHEVHAGHVVLAAGTFGSPQILHQSTSTVGGVAALGHLNQASNGWLGRGVSCNGDGIAAIYDQEGRTREVGSSGADPATAAQGQAIAGPTATGIIDMRNRTEVSKRFVIEDGAVPYPFMRLFEESVTTFGAAHAMVDWNWRGKDDDRDPLALDAKKMARSQFLLLMGHDDAKWRMDFIPSSTWVGAGAGHIQLSRVNLAPRHDDKDFESERERQRDVDRVVGGLARGLYGGRYIPNPLWEPVPQALQSALESDQKPPGGVAAGSTLMAERGITVHPLGGCRMADDVSQGVVNEFGQVFSQARGNAVHDNLVVLDGSIVPSSLGINPLLTIAALAERACDELTVRWGLRAIAVPPPAPPQLPAPVEPLPWSPIPTALRFRERLGGGLQLTIDPVGWPTTGPLPAPEVLRDVEVRMTAVAMLDDVEGLLRDPNHAPPHVSADLSLIWYVPPPGFPVARLARGAAGSRLDTATANVHIAQVPVQALRLLPSTREQRVWRAMQHWLDVRGNAFLHDRFKSHLVRSLALKALELFLKIDNDGLRSAFLAMLENLPLPGSLGSSRDEFVGLLKVASHHGEARVLSYDLGEIAPPTDGHPWPFKGKVRIIGAKRLHYGTGPGYHQRPSLGVPDPMLPKTVPTQFWRTIHELQALVLSRDEGRPVTADDWYPDQWPADVDPAQWKVVGRGVWTVNDVPLLTNDVPQLQDYNNLPDAWVDLASMAAFVARCFVQGSFWRMRLPWYPDPLPDQPTIAPLANPTPPPVPPRPRPVGPLPGQVLDTVNNVYVDAPLNGIAPVRTRIPTGDGVEILLTRFCPPAGGQPVLLIHAFVTSGYMFATPRVRCNAVEALTKAGFDTWVVELRTSVALPCSHDPWDFDIVGKLDVPAAVTHVFNACKQRVHVVAQCMGSAVFNMAVLQGLLDDANGQTMIASSVQVQVSMDIVASLPNHVKAVALRGMQTLMDMDEVDVVADRRTLGDDHRFAAIADRMLWMWPVNDVDAQSMMDNSLTADRQGELAGIRRITALYGRIFSWDNVPAGVRDHLPELFRHASMRAIEHLIRMERAGRIVDFTGKDCYVDDDAIRKHYRFPVLFVHGQFATVFGQGTTRRSRIRLDRLLPDFRHQRLVLPLRNMHSQTPLAPNTKAARKWGHFDLWVNDNAKTEFFSQLITFLGNPQDQHQAPPLPLPPAPNWQLQLPAWQHLGRWAPGAAPGSGRATVGFRNPFLDHDAVDACVVAIDIVLMNFKITTLVDWKRIQLYSDVGVIEAEVRPAHQDSWICVVCRTQNVAVFSDPDYTHEGSGQQVWWVDPTRGQTSFHAVTAAKGPAPVDNGGAAHTVTTSAFPKLGVGSSSQLMGAHTALPLSSTHAPYMQARRMAHLTVINAKRRPVRTRSSDWSDLAKVDAELTKSYEETGSLAPGAIRLNERAFAQLQPGDRLRFLMASCRYQASSAEQELADRVLARAMTQLQDGGGFLVETLDFALLLGDQIYADATYGVFDGRPSTERLRGKYAALWTGSAGTLASRVPTWVCIDDHEIRDDWYRGLRAPDDPDTNIALRTQAPAAPPPQPCLLDAERLTAAFDNQASAVVPANTPRGQFWYDFESCGFRVFAFDLRTERHAPSQGLWSAAQWAGFTTWLTASAAEIANGRPLLLAMSLPLFPLLLGACTVEYRERGDGWAAYRPELVQLVRALVTAKVTRLVLLAGDPHISHAASGWLMAPDGHRIELCSVVSSGLNAPLPSENTLRGELAEHWAGDLTDDAGNLVGRLDYTTRQACDEDSAASVDLQLSGDGSGRWQVQVQFIGRDSAPDAALSATVLL